MRDVIERSAVHIDAELGRGGEGRVYAATITGLGPVAYKEYARTCSSNESARLLHMVAAFWGREPADQLSWLTTFAWPLSAVQREGEIVGFVMPRVSDRFHTDFTTARGTKRTLASVELLLNGERYLQARGLDLDRPTQLRLLCSAAQAFASLHRTGHAVGDVSPKNMLFDAESDEAAVHFIDCDSMTVPGFTAADRVETPSWTVPVGDGGIRESSNTVASDSYKFGLLVLRLLVGSQDVRDPDRLPVDVNSLLPMLQRSLQADPAIRPTPAEWVPSLQVAARNSARLSGASLSGRTSEATFTDRGASRESVAVPDSEIQWQRVDRAAFDQRIARLTACEIVGVVKPIAFGVTGADCWARYEPHRGDLLASFPVGAISLKAVRKLADVLDAAAKSGLGHRDLRAGDVRVDTGAGGVSIAVSGFDRVIRRSDWIGAPHNDLLGFALIAVTALGVSEGEVPGFGERVGMASSCKQLLGILEAAQRSTQASAVPKPPMAPELAQRAARARTNGDSLSSARSIDAARPELFVAGAIGAALVAVISGVYVTTLVDRHAVDPDVSSTGIVAVFVALVAAVLVVVCWRQAVVRFAAERARRVAVEFARSIPEILDLAVVAVAEGGKRVDVQVRSAAEVIDSTDRQLIADRVRRGRNSLLLSDEIELSQVHVYDRSGR